MRDDIQTGDAVRVIETTTREGIVEFVGDPADAEFEGWVFRLADPSDPKIMTVEKIEPPEPRYVFGYVVESADNRTYLCLRNHAYYGELMTWWDIQGQRYVNDSALKRPLTVLALPVETSR